MYDPRVGEWLSPDPIGFESGTYNLYEYVSNDPLNFVDPTGLAKIGDLSDQWQWHHMLPQALFRDRGIPIDQARYPWLLPMSAHQQGIHPAGWDEDWKEWLADIDRTKKKLTPELIQSKLDGMYDEYQKHLDQGFRAPDGLDYNTWESRSLRKQFLESHTNVTDQMVAKQKGWTKYDLENARARHRNLKMFGMVTGTLLGLMEAEGNAEAVARHYKGILWNLNVGNLNGADIHARRLEADLVKLQGDVHQSVLWSKAWAELKHDPASLQEMEQRRQLPKPPGWEWEMMKSLVPVSTIEGRNVCELFPGRTRLLQDIEGRYWTYGPEGFSGRYGPLQFEGGALRPWDRREWQDYIGNPLPPEPSFFHWPW